MGDGIIGDLRNVVVVVAAIVGGPIPALIAAAVAAAFRVHHGGQIRQQRRDPSPTKLRRRADLEEAARCRSPRRDFGFRVPQFGKQASAVLVVERSLVRETEAT